MAAARTVPPSVKLTVPAGVWPAEPVTTAFNWTDVPAIDWVVEEVSAVVVAWMTFWLRVGELTEA